MALSVFVSLWSGNIAKLYIILFEQIAGKTHIMDRIIFIRENLIVLYYKNIISTLRIIKELFLVFCVFYLYITHGKLFILNEFK